jgi:hypothetical protein
MVNIDKINDDDDNYDDGEGGIYDEDDYNDEISK